MRIFIEGLFGNFALKFLKNYIVKVKEKIIKNKFLYYSYVLLLLLCIKYGA